MRRWDTSVVKSSDDEEKGRATSTSGPHDEISGTCYSNKKVLMIVVEYAVMVLDLYRI